VLDEFPAKFFSSYF